ncbi:unnamed protein product [Cylicocyclus nassatus]|uniref:Uncharacterized protein n=1 Tax=Cylicocyclus nassatus TaxID=53992 RepID=A0AA36HCP7_CYLNA|nr:unnamed protein product [Cylicocyclus nassatus]
MSCGGRTPKSESSHKGDHVELPTSSTESGKTRPHRSEEKHEKSKLPSSEKKEHEDQKLPGAVQQPHPAADEGKQGGNDGYESCPDMTPTQLAKVLAEMK